MFGSHDRAVTPVIGAVLLVLLTVGLAATVGGFLLGDVPSGAAPTAHLDCEADAARDRIACVHGGGDRLDLRDLRLRLAVDDEPLAHQPPVPFFAARGFRAGPTGPFNSAADPHWSAGETAALELAGTNRPGLTPEAAVRVTVVADGHVIARVTMDAK